MAQRHSLLWIAVLFATAIALSLLSEYALPYEVSWNHANVDSQKDVTHGVIYEVANIVAIMLLPIINMLIPWGNFWPSTFPIAMQLLVAILIVDFSLTMIF